MIRIDMYVLFFFFNDTATTEIYTLSLHDALPISVRLQPGEEAGIAEQAVFGNLRIAGAHVARRQRVEQGRIGDHQDRLVERSEEHTSELQSRQYLVCRLLLEKKKKEKDSTTNATT